MAGDKNLLFNTCYELLDGTLHMAPSPKPLTPLLFLFFSFLFFFFLIFNFKSPLFNQTKEGKRRTIV